MNETHIHSAMQDQAFGAFSLNDLWESVYRRKWVVVGITLLFTLVALIFVQTKTDEYYAEAKISLESQEKNIDLESVISGLPLDTSFIATEIQVILSRNLISNAVDRLHPTMKLEENSDDETIRRHHNRIGHILGRLKVSQIGKSRAISVGFKSESPTYAAKVANTVAEVYIEQQILNRFDAISTTSKWLGERVRKLREKVRETETLVVQYRRQEGIVDSRGIDIIEQDILEISSNLNRAKSELTAAEARLEETKDGALNSSPSVLSSPIIVRLRDTEARARSEIARLSKEYGPSHPEMVAARAELGAAQSKIRQEINSIGRSIETAYKVAKENVRRIEEDLVKLKTDYDRYKNSNVELQDLEREAAANRELLEVLNARLKETEAQEDNNLQDPNARIISEATVPFSPTGANKKLILAAAIIAGLGLSIALCIGIDQFQTGAYNGKQLQNISGVTNISLVPRTKVDPGRGINLLADFPVKEPYAVYTESIRSISMFIRLHLSKAPDNNVFNFTSCLGNEGKSSVVSSLSRQMALEGLRVLAIDCDMRKPRLGRTFGVDPKFGFHDVLKGQKTLDEVMLQDEVSGLNYVTSGKLEDVNVISREITRWEEIINDAKQRYDVILLDSPPILFVADTKLIAKTAQNILCVQSKKTPTKLIGYAVDMLNRLECDLIGTVITMASSQNKYLYEYEEYKRDAA